MGESIDVFVSQVGGMGAGKGKDRLVLPVEHV